MSDVTNILSAIEAGDRQAANQLLPLVYDELRKLAARKLADEKPGQTLDATALVHEAYLRLVGKPDHGEKSEHGEKSHHGDKPRGSRGFDGRSHFFAAAAQAMQRILVDQARRKRAEKRGGGGRRFELSESDRVVIPDPETLLTVNEVIERLAEEDAGAAELARLRLFAGFSIEEAAAVLNVSRATAFRDWSYARAVLSAALADKNSEKS